MNSYSVLHFLKTANNTEKIHEGKFYQFKKNSGNGEGKCLFLQSLFYYQCL